MKVRKITLNDAEAMLSLNISLDAETDFMLHEPGERQQSVESQAKLIQGALLQERLIWLVAEAGDGCIAGYCVVAGKPQQRVKHIGSLVIGVAKRYWSQGVGSCLLEAAIEQGIGLCLTKLELSVRADNKRAIALYKKLGFAEEGLRKSALLIDGEYFDELYMAKLIDEDVAAALKDQQSICVESDIFNEFIAACDKAQRPNQALLDAAKLARESDVK